MEPPKMAPEITYEQYGKAKALCESATLSGEFQCNKASVEVNKIDEDIRCEWTKTPLEVKGNTLQTGVIASIKQIFTKKDKVCSVAPAIYKAVVKISK